MRISAIDSRELLHETERGAWDEITASRGQVRGPFAVLLHSPELAKRAAHLGTYLRHESQQLAPTVRYVACLAVARHFDCQYAWAGNLDEAKLAGLSDTLIDDIRDLRPIAELGEQESIAQEIAKRLLEWHRIPDIVFARAKTTFTDQELVELVGYIGYYSLMAAVLNAFEVDPAPIYAKDLPEPNSKELPERSLSERSP